MVIWHIRLFKYKAPSTPFNYRLFWTRQDGLLVRMIFYHIKFFVSCYIFLYLFNYFQSIKAVNIIKTQKLKNREFNRIFSNCELWTMLQLWLNVLNTFIQFQVFLLFFLINPLTFDSTLLNKLIFNIYLLSSIWYFNEFIMCKHALMTGIIQYQ